jgi:hypothetical protein
VSQQDPYGEHVFTTEIPDDQYESHIIKGLKRQADKHISCGRNKQELRMFTSASGKPKRELTMGLSATNWEETVRSVNMS